jgi:hypothetical protein
MDQVIIKQEKVVFKVKEEDIPKIVFHTHEGHYDFLGMPFDLCNVPSSF